LLCDNHFNGLPTEYLPYHTGPLPDPEVDQSDIPDEFPDLPNLCADNDGADDDDSVDIPLEDGNHILVASIPPEEEFIHTSSTTSQ